MNIITLKKAMTISQYECLALITPTRAHLVAGTLYDPLLKPQQQRIGRKPNPREAVQAKKARIRQVKCRRDR